MEDKKPIQRRWFRFSLRTTFVVVALLGMLVAYASSYYVLSRRGMRESRELEMAGFLYVPWQEASATHDLTRHFCLSRFYFPLNVIDQGCFGGGSPIIGITWDLD